MLESESRHLLARFLFTGDSVFKRINLLSGGEKSRLVIAKLILREPDVLIPDEPTNHLDVASRECLEDALSEFRGTVIAVSHDRYFLNYVVNRIFEIENGAIRCYRGNYASYRRQKTDAARSSGLNRSSTDRVVSNVLTGRGPSSGERSRASRVRQMKRTDRDELEKRILEEDT